MKSVIFDTETSGLTRPSVSDLDKQPHIIEIGLMIFEGGKAVHEYSQLINPGFDVSAEITKITGITNDMLKGMPSFQDVAAHIALAFNGCDQLFAHNAEFDCNVLRYELARHPDMPAFPWPPVTICTVQEYVHEFGHRPKLSDLYERKLGKPMEKAHRALDDVKALAEVLMKEEML